MKAQFIFPAFCAAIAVTFSSCTHQNSGNPDEPELADPIASGTIPPWIAENADSYETGVYDSGSKTPSNYAYNPPAKPKVSGSSSSSSSARKSTARTSTKPSSSKSTKSTRKSSSTTYTVKKGDTLGAIAKRNGTTVSAIKKANGLKSDLIGINQKLSIPRK